MRNIVNYPTTENRTARTHRSKIFFPNPKLQGCSISMAAVWFSGNSGRVRISHLISSHLISSHLNLVAVSAPWSDPVRRGCDQSDKTSRPASFWLVAATVNRIALLQRTSAQFRLNDFSWDEVIKWNERLFRRYCVELEYLRPQLHPGESLCIKTGSQIKGWVSSIT